MKYPFILISLLMVVTFSSSTSYAQSINDVRILETLNSIDGEYDAQRLYSVQYLLEVAGVPYQISRDVKEVVKGNVIICTRGYDGNNLSQDDFDLLQDFVQNGGILILPNLKDPRLFNLSGIVAEDFSRDRYQILPNISDYSSLFAAFNHEREFILSIGDRVRKKAMNTRAYTASSAEVLMRFDDDSAALTKNSFGNGFVYTFGFAFRDVVTRNQMNRDLSAHRSYSNDFEAVTDLFAFIFREILASHSPSLVYKHTSIGSSRSTLILTHDVDSSTGMEWMSSFAAEEYRRNIQGTFLITTHYTEDDLGGNFYSPYRHLIKPIYDLGHEIGSHSVGHLRDFSKQEYGSLGNTMENYYPIYRNGESTDASILGELEVSKNLLEEDINAPIYSFRSGHLEYPNKLINGLSELGYAVNSTYSANDVLTSFPFYTVKNRSFSGDFTDVLEIPMTISDVFDDGFTEENYPQKVALWTSVSEKYFENEMPVVLLIHPNRDYKLTALTDYLNGLDQDIQITGLHEFAQFWIKRNALQFQCKIVDNELIIELDNDADWDHSIGLKVRSSSQISSIKVLQSNSTVGFDSQTLASGELLILPNQSTTNPEPEPEPDNSILVLPQIGQTEVAIPTAIQWKPMEGAETYELQLAYSASFDTSFTMRSLPINQLVLNDFLKDTTDYFWRVRAKNGANFLEWSEIGHFRTMLRLPEQPFAKEFIPTHLRDDAVRISWSPAKRAKYYEVQISKSSYFETSDLIHFTELKNPHLDIKEEELPIDGFWRVRATNEKGKSEWSEAYSNRSVLTSLQQDELPERFTLYQNYPNPFNPTTQISFYLPSSSMVELSVFNTQGQMVSELINQRYSSGKHSLSLNAANWPSGLYFYRIKTIEGVQVKKMTLIK